MVKRFRGKAWYAYSIYLPEDFVNSVPVKQAMAQFHQKGSWPTLMFQLTDDGYYAKIDNGKIKQMSSENY